MLESLEGKRGVVRAKPPLPAIEGLFGRPTIVNNVLTLATVPPILAGGPAGYQALGVGRSRGTQVFQLAGNVARGGIVELPFGVTLGELVDECGGGTRSGRPVRAVQVGGPLGAYLPTDQLRPPDGLRGACRGGWRCVGHGGVVVFDDTVDIARQARFAMEFCAEESCGKCTPCRVGAVRGVELIDRILAGDDRRANLGLLEDLCEVMTDGSLCAMGGLTPMPVRSALRHFARRLRPCGRYRGTMSMNDDASPPERDLGTQPVAGDATVDRRRRRSRGHGAGGHVGDARRGARRGSTSRSSAPPTASTRSGRAGSASSRSRAARARRRRARRRSRRACRSRPTTERLARLRRGVMELYLSDHRRDCLPGRGERRVRAARPRRARRCSRATRYGEGARPISTSPADESNPYFTFDPTACIVCSRCVRACDEIQGTIALTIEGRGFDVEGRGERRRQVHGLRVRLVRRVRAGVPHRRARREVGPRARDRPIGASSRPAPTAASAAASRPSSAATRSSGWCPTKDGGANEGHSCVKGRFAWGYANARRPRAHAARCASASTDPWREVDVGRGDRATPAERFRAIQDRYGVDAIGGITSSRCTNEEVFVVQKMVRAAFGNNNVDTCARVCHSPTGFGLKQTFGTSAGTQDFRSVDHADVILLIGANPTDAHPVFASRMKQRLRQGAQLIVVDPRRIDLVRSPHVEAAHHLQLLPGHQRRARSTRSRTSSSPRASSTSSSSPSAASPTRSSAGATFISAERAQPRGDRARSPACARPADGRARPPACTPTGGRTRRSTTGSASPSTARARRWSWGWRTSPWRPATSAATASASTRCAARTTCRARATWARSRTSCRATGTCPTTRRARCSRRAGASTIDPEPGLRIPNMFSAALGGEFKGLFVQGEDLAQSDPNTEHVVGRARGDGVRRRAGPVPQRDRERTRTSSSPAPPSWRRTARSPTPSAGSTGSAR